MTTRDRDRPNCSLADQLLDAAAVVAAVRAGGTASQALTRLRSDARPAARALAFESLRHLSTLEWQLSQLAERAPKENIRSLLIVGFALLRRDAVECYAEHAVVSQCVEAAKRIPGKSAGFVNAVLRRFLRDRDALIPSGPRTEALMLEHPAWWVKRLQNDWPAHWHQVLQAANSRPPMYLRVNARVSSGAEYIARLTAEGRSCSLISSPGYGDRAIALNEAVAVDRLPGFATGAVSVQDLAAQRAAHLLVGAGLSSGARVLDACSAPGGKAAHLLELADIDLLCIDSDALRAQRIVETLARLQLNARVKTADAAEPLTWWDGRLFDAILLDAPCSASGIVRRHPDIRWLRREADIAALARAQDRLLNALWPLLRVGGHLLFATCSVFKAEGSERIDAFLQRHPVGSACLFPSSPGHLLPVVENAATACGGSIWLPDGFFYAILEKRS